MPAGVLLHKYSQNDHQYHHFCPGAVLEMLTLRPYPRPNDSESTFNMIHTIKSEKHLTSSFIRNHNAP